MKKEIIYLAIIIILLGGMAYNSISAEKQFDRLNAKIDTLASETDALKVSVSEQIGELNQEMEYRLTLMSEDQVKSQEAIKDSLSRLWNRVIKKEEEINEDLKRIEEMKIEKKRQQTYVASSGSYSSGGSYNLPTDGLTKSGGVNYHDGHKETYYNLPMDGVIAMAQSRGVEGEYWVRDDGVKMYGDYVIVAGSQDKRDTIVDTSLGQGIVLDTGSFAYDNPEQYDIATDW